MSERAARGSVPARADKDNRVAFYPSGLAGVGPRRYYRADSTVEAESFADAIRLGRGDGPQETHYTEPAPMAMKAFIVHLQNSGGLVAPGPVPVQLEMLDTQTVSRSPARCRDLDELHWASVFAARSRTAGRPRPQARSCVLSCCASRTEASISSRLMDTLSTLMPNGTSSVRQ